MESAEDRLEPARASVLLFTQDQLTGRSFVAALAKATIPVEWVRTASALRSRLARADLPRPSLVMVLPSRQDPLPPSELARVALRLTTDMAGDLGPQNTTAALGESLSVYCSLRSLSRRQKQVLELYLVGNNDKEIADAFRCSATTVYEHWRRMAKKAKGVCKSDVVSDFHRFLAARSDAVSPHLPSLLAAPGRSSPPAES